MCQTTGAYIEVKNTVKKLEKPKFEVFEPKARPLAQRPQILASCGQTNAQVKRLSCNSRSSEK